MTLLAACPICGRHPVRNGRGGSGGVICSSTGIFDPRPSHRVQTYGATQEEADDAWNQGAASAAARYRSALERIDAAALDGKVCDDVAWFGPAETLHDFIQSVLHPSEPAAVADLFPTTDAA